MIGLSAFPPAEIYSVESETSPENQKRNLGVSRSSQTGVYLDQSRSTESGSPTDPKLLGLERQDSNTFSTLNDLLKVIETQNRERVRDLFEAAFSARGTQKESLKSALRAQTTADLIASVAIDEFRKYGNEDRLSLTSSMLLEFPENDVLLAIERLAEMDMPEVTSFLGILEYLNAPKSYRQRLISRFKLSQNPEVPGIALSLLGEDA